MIAATLYAGFIAAVAYGEREIIYCAAIPFGVAGTLLWATMNRVVIAYSSTEWQGRSFAFVSIATSCGIAAGTKAFGIWQPIVGNETFVGCAVLVGIGASIFALLPNKSLDEKEGETRNEKRETAHVCKNCGLVGALLLGLQLCNVTWGGVLSSGVMLFGVAHQKSCG